MVKKSFFSFDETLEDEIKETIDNLKDILDYLVYKNQEGLITIDCWETIKESDFITEQTKMLLRGSFDIKDINKGKPELSTVSCLNFESQFKPMILITRKDAEEFTSLGLKNVVRVVDYKEVAKKIKEDEDFFMWKTSELWKIQKFKG